MSTFRAATAAFNVVVRVQRTSIWSVEFSHEVSPPQTCMIVVLALSLALGKLDLAAWRLFVGNLAEDVRDAVETRALLVIGAHDVPGSMPAVGRLEHHVARAGIIVPAGIGFEIHWGELPLPQRIV